jgi:hypothetical protein
MTTCDGTPPADEKFALYVEHARRLIARVQGYEDVHPKGAPCFYDALERMKAVVGDV